MCVSSLSFFFFLLYYGADVAWQFALAALGRIEGLLDYNRIRADMSSLVY
jgi:hypothetical protein